MSGVTRVVYVVITTYLPDPDCHSKLAGVFEDEHKAIMYAEVVMEDDNFLCYVNKWEIQ